MKTTRAYKKVPNYWWDFEDLKNVIIESDDDRYPVVARFSVKGVDASREIDMADKLIDDLNCGRITIKDAMQKFL